MGLAVALPLDFEVLLVLELILKNGGNCLRVGRLLLFLQSMVHSLQAELLLLDRD